MVATKDSKDKKKGAKGVKDEKSPDETVNSNIIQMRKQLIIFCFCLV